jgi:hypothetical protein
LSNFIKSFKIPLIHFKIKNLEKLSNMQAQVLKKWNNKAHQIVLILRVFPQNSTTDLDNTSSIFFGLFVEQYNLCQESCWSENRKIARIYIEMKLWLHWPSMLSFLDQTMLFLSTQIWLEINTQSFCWLLLCQLLDMSLNSIYSIKIL